MAGDKVIVSFTVDPKDLEWMDKMAKRLQCSRSAVLSMCVDCGREDWKMLSVVGIKPEHLPLMRDAIKRMKESFIKDARLMEQS